MRTLKQKTNLKKKSMMTDKHLNFVPQVGPGLTEESHPQVSCEPVGCPSDSGEGISSQTIAMSSNMEPSENAIFAKSKKLFRSPHRFKTRSFSFSGQIEASESEAYDSDCTTDSKKRKKTMNEIAPQHIEKKTL